MTEGEDGRALVKCQHGCETPDVMTALGLRMADLFTDADDGEPWTWKKIVKSDHNPLTAESRLLTDEDGTPHTRRQSWPDGHEEWYALRSSSPEEATDVELSRAVRRYDLTERAREIVRDRRAGEELEAPQSRLTLADELECPEEPIAWRIDPLWPRASNVTIAAQYKTGKTTLTLNLLRSLVDGEPFFDTFDVGRPDGRVAFWNYELAEGTWRRWAREMKIRNPDRAAVLNLRGFHLPLASRAGSEFAIRWLGERETETWIIDPFGAALDGDENDNSAVRDWLRAVDRVAARAGVREIAMPVHTGRAKAEEGEERARGATRLDDWTDVRWVLTAEKGTRFLEANGRDVDHRPVSLGYDPDSRRLAVAGYESRAERRRDGVRERAYAVVAAAGPDGINTTGIEEGMGGRKAPGLAAVLRDLVTAGSITLEQKGRARIYRPAADSPKVRKPS